MRKKFVSKRKRIIIGNSKLKKTVNKINDIPFAISFRL
jgi:hypothetical protein